MLEPSALAAELIPSSFLPHLPRSQTTLYPIGVHDILAHILVLRTLYLPPIHGGFLVDERDVGPACERVAPLRAGSSRDGLNGRDSAGLCATLEGLGLELEGGGVGSSTSWSPAAVVHAYADEEDEDEDEIFGLEEEDDENQEAPSAHLDPFEREWAEKWLNGVVRRSQGWLEEHDGDDDDRTEDVRVRHRDVEAVLREATAVLAMMAGTSAAGSLTRHLLFPVDPALSPALRTLTALPMDPNLSPETTTFLKSLARSPASPVDGFLRRSNASYSPEEGHAFSRRRSSTVRSDISTSPETGLPPRGRRRRKRRPAIPVLLHDAPMADHLSVGVQTWGSAILLGRQMALRPADFGLFADGDGPHGVRVLELGAGTGLLSILCRKLLDLHASHQLDRGLRADPGLVVATDFHPDVLANLKICVDLNFEPRVVDTIQSATDTSPDSGILIAKLDWTTFPSFMADKVGDEDMARFVNEPFDLVLASDCVYDPTHAEMLRQVAAWVLRLPDPDIKGDSGGTMHILSPLRPTFTPELESIDKHFPRLSTYPPLPVRQGALVDGGSVPLELQGEGLGRNSALKLGVRGEGKRGVKGRKGEGRVDEVAGYWWWEVGWG